MFSQFRQVVDNLAAQPLRNPELSGNSQEDLRNSADRSRSLDISSTSTHSTTPGQLAESALVTLRKSLSAHRSTGSTLPKVSTPESKSPKLNLEDRLRRATFAIGELSGSSSPIPSGRSSPLPHKAVTKDYPLPPSSIPLPDSPLLSSNPEPDLSLDSPPVINLAEDEPILSSKPQISQHTSTDEPSSPLQEDALQPPTDEPSGPLQENALQPLTQSPLEEVTPSGVDTLDAIPAKTYEEVTDMSDSTGISTVDGLQERLKQIEQRFTDVSASFKRLQAEKVAADAVLRELSPLESIDDSIALREYLLSLGSKNKICQDEINQLNMKLQTQDSRIDELRETHKLETASQSDQIEKLKIQFSETDALFKDAQNSVANAEDNVLQRDTDIHRLKAEVDRIKIVAKEEEEKRTKAISLLKTVRQKLVKAEKERDDAAKEVAHLRDKEKADKDKMQTDRVKLQQEIEALGVEKEKEKSILRLQLEKEGAVTREKLEKQISALRSQYELDTITLKSNQSREISSKNSQITTLENSLNNITRDKNDLFDQLQLRQAELESARAHIESLQNENTELQFQFRETGDRMAMLKEEFVELQREQDHRLREPVSSAGELAHFISTTEAKYESKLNEMKRNVSSIERERNENEAEWSRKLREKVKEVDELKRVLGSAAKTREEGEETVIGLVAEIKRATDEANSLRRQVSELPRLLSRITELEQLALSQETEVTQKVTTLEQLIEESKARESQLKQNNKTIREELRKVQSSAALLERQRNPGVGYWTSRTVDNNGAEPRKSVSSVSSESLSRVGSPAPNSTNTTKNEEEVNLEYLRNVILQFLEHKEMRPNLVKVLSIILHFTPQETRRLVAKV